MAEYIKRMSAMVVCEKYSEHCFEQNDGHGQHIADGIFDDITNIPTADVVEVRHGEWIEGKTLEKCSLCGKKGFPDWRYCPNCGANMTGKGADPTKIDK